MGYRRFIAYVYEYRKGKKEDNCGFMKVEVRNHMCTIEPHLQVGNLAAGEVCKVYGFVRKEGLMNGILLGSCKTEANRIECLVETDGMKEILSNAHVYNNTKDCNAIVVQIG